MTCRELVDLVTDYLESGLSENDRTRFERHLDSCSGCRTYVEQMRRAIALTGQLREDDVPLPARDALLAAFRTWRAAGEG